MATTKVTISGTIQTPGGAAIRSGTVTARLSDSASALDGASTVMVATKVVAPIARGGQVSLHLPPNDALTPAGTRYLVKFEAKLDDDTRERWEQIWQVPSGPALDIGAVPRLDAVQGQALQPTLVGVQAQASAAAASAAAAATSASDAQQASTVTVTATGTTTARLPRDRWAETINVKDLGAKGDGVTDDTASINAAIAKASAGCAVYFPSGAYKVTSTITLQNKVGLRLFGETRGAFGTSGARIVWYGGSADPIIKCIFHKHFLIEGLQLVAADQVSNIATAGIVFTRDPTYTSNGPGVVRNVRVVGTDYGVMLGDASYANDYSVSEITFSNCDFDTRIGVFIAGVASGSQNVNNTFYDCNFGYSKLQRGVWMDGGHAAFYNCTFNASSSAYDASAFYFTGDRSLTQPIVISGGYSEQINKFIETEFTATATQWNRQGTVTVISGYWHCNRGASQELITCYKNLSITLINVEGVSANITYSPPADAAQASYSTTAPSTAKLTLVGRNSIGTITLTRGGSVLSFDNDVPSTMPSGFGFPTYTAGVGTAATLPIPTGGKNFRFQDIVLVGDPANLSHDLTTITGGYLGQEVTLQVQYAFRPYVVKNNSGGGNIRLQGGAGSSFTMDATTKRLTLRKGSDGNWFEVGRAEN